MTLQIVAHLLVEALKNPVFGDSFDEHASAMTGTTLRRVDEILKSTAAGLVRLAGLGMPELGASEISDIVWQIVPKAVCFCPALAVGELEDTRRLAASSVAIGLMYWGDQTMDRGDEAMALAIELFGGGEPQLPEPLAELVHTRLSGLQHIEHAISELARPEDAPIVLACFREQVLLNEVRLRRLSADYQKSGDHSGFLVEHAGEIAHRMVVDAGFPSVAAALYAIYRQHSPELPPLTEVYAERALVDMLQVCNSVVRVADELGDWEIDSGYDPAWGGFALNLFNQSHPALLRAFLREARIRDEARIETLLRAFAGFRDDAAGREAYGECIMSIFFKHGCDQVNGLTDRIRSKYATYIRICKRVLEIGYVNQVGDIALAGGR